jgi:hypothetical protein
VIRLLFETIKKKNKLFRARGHVHLRRGRSRCRPVLPWLLNLVRARARVRVGVWLELDLFSFDNQMLIFMYILFNLFIPLLRWS